jgi:lipocalin
MRAAITLMAIIMTGVVTLFCCQAQKNEPMINNSSDKTFDLERYLGTWYEIARFPHSFEKDLVGVTATYSLRKDGKIDVLNQGFLHTLDGKLKKAKGKAKIPDPDEPRRLKVSFFLFFFSDYLVLELDEKNYQWALIGSSSPDYLWVLSRKPVLQGDVYEMLLNKAVNRGYDLSNLQKVPQPDPD